MKSYTALFLSFLLLAACTQETPQENEGHDTLGTTASTDSMLVSDSENQATVDEDPIDAASVKLTAHPITLEDGSQFNLSIPEGFEIAVAAQGMKRVRFMAMSPDNRLFVPDMYNRTDNKKGKIYILEDFNQETKAFKTTRTYLRDLHNPNSIAFYTDTEGQEWFYIALTGELIRYKYSAGDTIPQGKPEVIATFPDYGLSYKYGGWHLTRTIAFTPDGKLYVSVGSSCNDCIEKESVRASILVMNPDGSDKQAYVEGLRNAVGIRWIKNALYATNMGADHLGDDKPQDLFYRLQGGTNYGWPYVFQHQDSIYSDPKYDTATRRVAPESVPLAYEGFPAHSSPLGFDYFDKATAPALKNYFLVALHGSSIIKLGHGYDIVRVKHGAETQPFVTGFLDGMKRNGRPCDILQTGPNSFFFTDDFAGIVYYIWKSEPSTGA